MGNSKFILKLLFVAVFFIQTANAQPLIPPVMFETPLSSRIASYDIKAELDVATNRVFAKQILTWKNTGSIPVQVLRMHLYMNAFRNSESTFMIESGRRFNGIPKDKSSFGAIDIQKIALLPPSNKTSHQQLADLYNRSTNAIPGIDLTPNVSFIQPDKPEHSGDKTLIEIRLQSPILPGRSAEIFFDFTTQLPNPPYARTGAVEDYYFVAQWFPKISVWKDDQWISHQFHTNSEFFADFGVYNIHLTVPENYVVGATGVNYATTLMSETAQQMYSFYAEDVHDFAWVAGADLVEFKGVAQDVEIRALMHKNHISQGARHIEATKKAVEYFQNMYGDYPYPNITVVDPHPDADEVGGMEYPMLFTVGTIYGLPESIRWPELVIIHEFGHNYWHGMVASNEFTESWLDEGINSYTEMKAMSDIYGDDGNLLNIFDLKLNNSHMQRLSHLSNPNTDPIRTKTWEFYSNGSYGINSYNKPAIVLKTIENIIGEAKMQQLLRTYFERWKFNHPSTDDFINIAVEFGGAKLRNFLDQALNTTHELDYKVAGIRYINVQKNSGIDFFSDSTNIADSVIIKTAEATLRSEVRLLRKGEFICPVEIDVFFEDGTRIREDWDGKSLWKKLYYDGNNKVVAAVIDPDNKLVMDVNYTNNSYTLQPKSIGVNKLTAKWLFWTQFFLDQPELLNILTFIGE